MDIISIFLDSKWWCIFPKAIKLIDNVAWIWTQEMWVQSQDSWFPNHAASLFSFEVTREMVRHKFIFELNAKIEWWVYVLSHVRLFAAPWTVALQAPLSMGFPRQNYWSGLPFPSPRHEREKWKWSRSVVSDSSDPMNCSLPGSSVHGIFQA